MRVVNTMQELSSEYPGDLPAPPIRYDEFFERELRERTHAAYELGLDRGSKHRLVMLLIGMLFGFLLGVIW